ncbi:hypothetical protein M501DRAFT_1000861 [Patellaria atrata CBS 101060]|uniref:Uncharacterized protein n=1 Tax=Patellaria atrata CBS 101060 TaxID=1346257 RepID=A0A9P4SFY0_9PEZI|nr:hypothetical protein M501DRAFT_1000861 [Patellaria atrata CBS 101060]
MVWGTDEGTEECIEDIELQDLKPDTTTGETGGEHGRDAELHVGSGTVDRRSVGTGTGRDMEGWDLDAVDIQLEDLRDYPWMEVIGDRDIGQDIEQDIEFYDLRDFPWIEDGSLGCDAADIEGTGGVEGTDGTDAMDTRGEQGGRGFVRL